MVTLHCTRKLLKYLHIVPDKDPEPPTGALGDWYANLIPNVAAALPFTFGTPLATAWWVSSHL